MPELKIHVQHLMPLEIHESTVWDSGHYNVAIPSQARVPLLIHGCFPVSSLSPSLSHFLHFSRPTATGIFIDRRSRVEEEESLSGEKEGAE